MSCIPSASLAWNRVFVGIILDRERSDAPEQSETCQPHFVPRLFRVCEKTGLCQNNNSAHKRPVASYRSPGTASKGRSGRIPQPPTRRPKPQACML